MVLEMVRGGYGAAQLIGPGLLADRVLALRLDPSERVVVRVLGARHLLQALGSGSRPGYPALALGVEVDLLHTGSMLALGLLDRRRRRAALSDAVIAGGFTIAGALAAHAARGPHPPPPDGSAMDRLRYRWSDRFAALFVPRYPRTQRS